jgi:hypothetical protein
MRCVDPADVAGVPQKCRVPFFWHRSCNVVLLISDRSIGGLRHPRDSTRLQL